MSKNCQMNSSHEKTTPSPPRELTRLSHRIESMKYEETIGKSVDLLMMGKDAHGEDVQSKRGVKR